MTATINVENENKIAVYALGKTIACCLYSILVAIVMLPVGFLTPIAQLPASQQNLVLGSLFLLLEGLTLFFVIRGTLPGTEPKQLQGFNEKTIAYGIVAISILSSVFLRGSFEKELFRYLLVGSLLFIGIVYFITKSFISKSIRWGVISAFLPTLLELIIPLFHLE